MSHHVDEVSPNSESVSEPELASELQAMEDEDERADELEAEGATGAPRANPFLRFAFDASREDRLSAESSGTLKNRAVSPLNFPKSSSLAQRKSKRLRAGANDKTKLSPKLSSVGKVKFYDHLSELQDHLQPGLDVIFCGINPGVQSAKIGHHYGNPNNHFWSCLHESGFTSRRLDPREDHLLPKDFSLGLTNLTQRPTAEQNELSKREQVAGVASLIDKVVLCHPRVLCLVGLGIADIVKSQMHIFVQTQSSAGSTLQSPPELKGKATIGLQPYKIVHAESSVSVKETLFFAVSSTSGRVVRYQKADKIRQFQDLRKLLEEINNGTHDTSGLLSIRPRTSAGFLGG